MHNNPNISVVDNYDNAIFTGASIKTDVYNIDSLQALPGVARAWVNKRVKLAVTTNATTAIFPAPQILNYTTHNVTGVSAVHAKGFLGQGVKVGVVDTGTWYLHPAVSLSTPSRTALPPPPPSPPSLYQSSIILPHPATSNHNPHNRNQIQKKKATNQSQTLTIG